MRPLSSVTPHVVRTATREPLSRASKSHCAAWTGSCFSVVFSRGWGETSGPTRFVGSSYPLSTQAPDKDSMTAQPLFEALERSTSITPSPESSAGRRADEGMSDGSLHVRTQFLRRVAHDIASPAGVTMTVLEELANESRRPELVAMARR